MTRARIHFFALDPLARNGEDSALRRDLSGSVTGCYAQCVESRPDSTRVIRAVAEMKRVLSSKTRSLNQLDCNGFSLDARQPFKYHDFFTPR